MWWLFFIPKLFDKIFTPKPGEKKPVRNARVIVGPTQFIAMAGKEEVTVNWEHIRKVTVIATDLGPWIDQLFYHVAHDSGDITLPAKARGMEDLIKHFKSLPGFDANAFERVGSLTQKDTFVVILRTEEPVA